jgi:hypothetical protein
MKIYTLVGSRMRLEPCISSLIVRTYIKRDIELNQISNQIKEDGLWIFASDSEDGKKGWFRSDFIKKIYDDE